MAKVLIDEKFGELIKVSRLQNNISAKSLAEHIKKSPAYISKLEHGEIKSLKQDTFETIIDFIFKGKTNEDNLESIYKSLKFKYSDEEIEQNLWFLNFSSTECNIPFGKELVDYINNELTSNHISPDYLLSRINSNESLSYEEIQNNDLPINRWYNSLDSDDPRHHSIKIYLSAEQLYNILSNRVKKTNYIFMLCIVFYIEKIKRFGEVVHISDHDNTTIMSNTVDILNRFKFYTIIEKNKALSQERAKYDINEILNTSDRENVELLAKILGYFKMFSEYDVLLANKYLVQFQDNLESDLGFTIKLISLKYNQLNNLTTSNKKAFINSVNELIEKYSNIPEEKNNIELY